MHYDLSVAYDCNCVCGTQTLPETKPVVSHLEWPVPIINLASWYRNIAECQDI
jgi:hypothetical protein